MHSLLIIPKFFLSLNFLNFSDFRPRISFKLFLNTKDATLPTNLGNIFQSLLMVYKLIKLGRGLCLVLKMQKCI